MTGLVLARIHSTPPGDAAGAISSRSPEPPANPLLDGKQTGRSSASRAGQDTLVVQSRRCCSRPGVGIGVHGVVAPHEVVAMPQSLCRSKPPFFHGQPQDRGKPLRRKVMALTLPMLSASVPSCLEKDFRIHAFQKPSRRPDASTPRLLSYSRRTVRL